MKRLSFLFALALPAALASSPAQAAGPDEECVACHTTRGPARLSSDAHARAKVGCLDCHTPSHKEVRDGGRPYLLAPPRALCARCHASEARSFALPYAHRQGTEAMSCTACHPAHGAGRTGRLTLLGKGALCADCHAEKAEPYVYPHPPRAVRGCLSCHVAHGSANPRLLTRRDAAAACLECHANVPHELASGRYRSCVRCHTAVHGSNRDPKLRDE